MSDVREGALRSRAKRRGYKMLKSRKKISLENLGDYMLVDASTNAVSLGSCFDATLDEIAIFLS